MSIILPQPTDTLSADDHARLHRCIASDSAAPDQSITVNSSGRVVLAQPLVFPDNSVQSTAASGTVTQVTATGNIASTGGTTPAITFTGTLPTSNGGTGTTSNVNAANGVVKLDGSTRLPAVDGSQLTNIAASAISGVLASSNIPVIPYVKVSNTQSSGTGGGSTTAGSWQTAPLTTKDNDSSSIASLNSNQVTLPAGTYICRGFQTFYGGAGGQASRGQVQLYNVTGSATLIVGSGTITPVSNATVLSFVMGQFTLSTTSALVLQYQVGQSVSTQGLGIAMSFGGNEVYAVLEFTKVA